LLRLCNRLTRDNVAATVVSTVATSIARVSTLSRAVVLLTSLRSTHFGHILPPLRSAPHSRLILLLLLLLLMMMMMTLVQYLAR